MSDHALLNLLDELRKRDKMRGCSAMSPIKSMIYKHE